MCKCGQLRLRSDRNLHDRITQVSLDGLSTPLGRSQVLAVTEHLQSMGWSCTILSLEPETANQGADSGSASEMADGVRRCRRYQPRPDAQNRLVDAGNVTGLGGQVIAGLFGAFLAAVSGTSVPYVFDTRGYWVDEKIDAGRWFQDAASRAIARRVERELYRKASGVVTLTELAAEDVRSGRFGRRHPRDRAICIPTCVDYTKFAMARRDAPHGFLRAGPIVGYVGSLNPSYEYRRSLRLAASILEQIPEARFLR